MLKEFKDLDELLDTTQSLLVACQSALYELLENGFDRTDNICVHLTSVINQAKKVEDNA